MQKYGRYPKHNVNRDIQWMKLNFYLGSICLIGFIRIRLCIKIHGLPIANPKTTPKNFFDASKYLAVRK